MVRTDKSVSARKRVFSSETRLRRHADFQYIRQRGRKAVGRYCVIRCIAPPPDGCRRVGFVISRHYSPRAVVRNRARRLFRESYRQFLPLLSDCWLEFRPRAFMRRGIKCQVVGEEIQGLLQKLDVLRANEHESDIPHGSASSPGVMGKPKAGQSIPGDEE